MALRERQGGVKEGVNLSVIRCQWGVKGPLRGLKAASRENQGSFRGRQMGVRWEGQESRGVIKQTSNYFDGNPPTLY